MRDKIMPIVINFPKLPTLKPVVDKKLIYESERPFSSSNYLLVFFSASTTIRKPNGKGKQFVGGAEWM